MNQSNRFKPITRDHVRRNWVTAVAIGIVANGAFIWALTDAIRPVDTVVALASAVGLVAEHGDQRPLNLGRLPELVVRGQRI